MQTTATIQLSIFFPDRIEHHLDKLEIQFLYIFLDRPEQRRINIMDIFFTCIAFLFMLSFLSTIRAIVNKVSKNTTTLIILTSILFGGLFWSCLYIFAF